MTQALAATGGKREKADEIGRWFDRLQSIVQQIYDDPALRKHAADARLFALQMRMNMLYDKLLEYSADGGGAFAEQSIAAMLDKGAAFARFARCYVREHLDEYPNLAVYLD